MRDGYRYQDGKIIVSDYKSYNRNIRQEVEREYQDNIEEVLITENIIEYFEELKKEVNEKISDERNLIYAEGFIMYIKAIVAIFVNTVLSGGVLSGIITVGLHLGGLLSTVSINTIRNLSVLICFGGTIIFYINKVIRPEMNEIKNLKQEISISQFTLKEIDEELERQRELENKLNNDKRKENEASFAYDSEYKWVNDYIRLDYVDKISEKESNLWNNVADEEDKINQQEDQHRRVLTRKLVLPKRTKNM